MKKYSFALLAILFATSCYNDKEEELYPQPTGSGCDTSNVTYAGTIQPIFNQSCTLSTCHDAASVSGGYNLTEYAGAKLAVDNNRLLGAIKHLSGYSAMPKGGNMLEACKITQIEKWVAMGAPNN